MTGCVPVKLSRRLWSWIQHTLNWVRSAELTFNNCPTLTGAEVWRRLVVPVFARSTSRRFALRDKVQRSGMPAATTFDGTEAQIILWEKDLAAYQAALGPEPSDEDLRHALLKMIPASLSLEMKTKANAEGTSEGLKEWIRVQAEFIREQSGKGLHVMEQPAPAQPPASEREDDDEYEEEDEAEEVLDS